MPMAMVQQVATNCTVWPAWNQTYASTGATTNLVIDPAWVTWNQCYINGTSTSTSVTATQYTNTGWITWNTVYEETAEQKAEREQRAAETARQRADRQMERAAAAERAVDLLGMVLSAEQADSYRERGWFEVISSKGRRWRIRDRGQSGNVDLMPEIGDEREASYCAHPPEGLPDADAHLAQALTLVTDEDAFLRVAKMHYRRAG